MRTNHWLCPFCEWMTPMLGRWPDIGLIVIHLTRSHEETQMIPRALLSRGNRQHWVCPFCTGRPWELSWDFDEDGEDADMGLVVGAHVQAAHPEALYGPLVPASVVAKTLHLVGM